MEDLMHKFVIAIAMLVMASTSAYAGIFGNTTNNHHNNTASANSNASASARASVSVKNRVKVKNKNTNRNTNLNFNISKGGNAKQGQGQGQEQSLEYNEAKNPVSGASAPGLTSGGVSCMGSVSGGGQGMTFGFSIGTTYEDSRCNARQEAAALDQLGLRQAAVARMCDIDDVRTSMKLAGTPCPQEAAEAATEKALLTSIDTSARDDAE